MRLQVEAFTGGVRGNENTHRVLRRVGVKGPLDLLPLGRGVGPWKIAMRCSARSLPAMAASSCWNRYRLVSSYSVKMITRVSCHSAPRWPRVGHRCWRIQARRLRTRASGRSTGRLRHLGHGVEQLLFARKQGLGRRIGQRPEGRCGRRFDLRLFFRLEVLFSSAWPGRHRCRPPPVRRSKLPARSRAASGVVLLRVPLPLDGPAMHTQRAGKGLDRREQALLQPGDQEAGRRLRPPGFVLAGAPRGACGTDPARRRVAAPAHRPAGRRCPSARSCRCGKPPWMVADVFLQPPDDHLIAVLAA